MEKTIKALLISAPLFVATQSNADILADGRPISDWGTPCKNDPDHTLQQLIGSGRIGSDRVPGDVKFREDPREYKAIRLTTVYYWPVKNDKYSLFDLSCKFSCGYKILAECDIKFNQDDGWIAFRYKGEKKLLYIRKEDFKILEK